MVSLIDIYKVKESTFNKIHELKDFGDPARGNKGKDRSKEFYLRHHPADPETGSVKSDVVYKRSFENMVKDIEAEAIDMQKIADEFEPLNPGESIESHIDEEKHLQKFANDLKVTFNDFRTYVRKNYKLDEENVTGTGTSITTGESPAYATPHAFGDDKEKKLKTYKSIGYKPLK